MQVNEANSPYKVTDGGKWNVPVPGLLFLHTVRVLLTGRVAPRAGRPWLEAKPKALSLPGEGLAGSLRDHL